MVQFKKTLIAILILTASVAYAQAQKNVYKSVGVSYTAGAPNWTPTAKQNTEIARDSVTGTWYIWSLDSAAWHATQFIEFVDVAPTYTPGKGQPLVAIDSSGVIYRYLSGSWHTIGGGGGGGLTNGDKIDVDVYADGDSLIIDTAAITDIKVSDVNVSKITSGDLAAGFAATLPNTNTTARINYDNSNSALLIDDFNNGTSISGEDGTNYVYVDNGAVTLGSGSTKAEFVNGVLKLYDSDSTHSVSITVPHTDSLTTSWTFTFPSTDGSPNQVLTTNGSGITSWTTVSGVGGGTDTSGYNLTLRISGDTLYLADGNGELNVPLSAYLDNTDAQTLSVDSTTVGSNELFEVAVSGGNSVFITVPQPDGTGTDTSGYNQVLNISGDTLYITDGDGTLNADLSAYLDNTDAQTLSVDSTTVGSNELFEIAVSGGNSVFITVPQPDGTGTDTSGYNQVLNISGDTLYITDGDGTLNADLSPYLDNTDAQTLSVDSTTVGSNELFEVAVSGGNSVFITVPQPDGTGTDTSGYNQVLNISGDTLYLTDGDGTLNADLSAYLDNTDDQKIDTFSISSTTISLSMESDGEAAKTISLASLPVALSQLTQSGATTGQVPQWNGAAWVAATVTAGGDADSDPSNELQVVDTFSIVSDSLRISLSSDGESYHAVDLSAYLDNTDAQTLSVDSTTVGSNELFEVAVSGGNSVFITVPQPDGTGTDTSGYNQALTLSSDTLYLTDGNSTLNAKLTAANVSSSRLGSTTYSTLQDMQNIVHSTGWVSGGDVTDGGSGTVNVTAGKGLIKATDSSISTLYWTDWSASTGLALTDATTNYIYVDYNGGTPQVVSSTTDPTGDRTKIYLARVYRDGTHLHIFTGVRWTVGDHASLMMRGMSETMPFAHVSGAITTETGTRQLSVTAGVFWHGLTRIETPAINTSTGGTFSYYYRDGIGGWTEVASQTQINNTQYDNGTGTLATLSNNKYGVHWVFLSQAGSLVVVYGQGDYTLTEAQDAQVPTLPDEIQVDSRIIAKIIVLKSAASLTSVESAFMNFFQGAAISGADVSGPASSTDNAIVRFDGTTGKIIQNSGITIADGTSGTLSGTNSGDQSLFRTVKVSGQSDVVAENTIDTLTLTAGTGISLTTSATTDAVTITNSAPDQTVTISSGTGINVTGTYPSFTVTNTVTNTDTQDLSIDSTTVGSTETFTISLVDGGSVSLDIPQPDGTGTDTSGYNQTLTLSNDTLYITDGNSTLNAKLVGLGDGNGIYSGSDTIPASTTAMVTSGSDFKFLWATGNEALGLYSSGGWGTIYLKAESASVISLSPAQVKIFGPAGWFDNTLSGIVLKDTRATPKGIEYFADYSATYSNRSLVDKEYVDGLNTDTSGYNQTLSISGDTLYLTDGSSTLNANLSPYLDNTDAQTLSVDSTTVGSNELFEVAVSGGNSVFITVPQPDGTGTDTSGYNQSLTLSNDTLYLTDGNSTLNAKLTGLADGNGIYSGSGNIDISGGSVAATLSNNSGDFSIAWNNASPAVNIYQDLVTPANSYVLLSSEDEASYIQVADDGWTLQGQGGFISGLSGGLIISDYLGGEVVGDVLTFDGTYAKWQTPVNIYNSNGTVTQNERLVRIQPDSSFAIGETNASGIRDVIDNYRPFKGMFIDYGPSGSDGGIGLVIYDTLLQINNGLNVYDTDVYLSMNSYGEGSDIRIDTIEGIRFEGQTNAPNTTWAYSFPRTEPSSTPGDTSILVWNGKFDPMFISLADIGGGGAQTLSIDSATVSSTETFTVSISGGNSVSFNVPQSSLTDGDKGDIDVTASGATWTVDTAAITAVKLNQMGAATGEYLRWTGSTWDPDSAKVVTDSYPIGGTGTASDPITFLPVGSTGQVFKWNGSFWAAGDDSNGIYSGSGTSNATVTTTGTFQIRDNDNDNVLSVGHGSPGYVDMYSQNAIGGYSEINMADGNTIIYVDTAASIKVRDYRGNAVGMEYYADYSNTLKANARSIPDVGTVQGLISDSLATLVGDGNGIYSGDGATPDGGTTVDLTGDDPLIFDVTSGTGQTNRMIRFDVDYTNDDAYTHFMQMATPNDSMYVTSFDSGIEFNYYGTTGLGTGLKFVSNTKLVLDADSIYMATLPQKASLPNIMGTAGAGVVSRLLGVNEGDVVTWDSVAGNWVASQPSAGVSDHGSLSGLADDDHTQYALLAGRASGQVLTGGTASGDDLTIRSTSNATKGSVIIGDTGGDVLINGATSLGSPYSLVVSGAVSTTAGRMYVRGSGNSGDATASLRLYNTSGLETFDLLVKDNDETTITTGSGEVMKFNTDGIVDFNYGIRNRQITESPTFATNNYTLVIGDEGKLLQLSNGATAGTLTVPTNASVAFPVGTHIDLIQTGSGQLTVTPAGGVTINSADSKTKFRVQYSGATLVKTATNTWLLFGDISL